MIFKHSVAFVSLAEGIDATTPAGKLQLHILGAIAEFERERIRERVLAGLQRARVQGKRLGRPKASIPVEQINRVCDLPGTSRPSVWAYRDRRSSGGADSIAGLRRRVARGVRRRRCLAAAKAGPVDC
jgi:hypothetical protein